MQVSEIELFQILKDKVGEREAKTITEYIETKIEKQFDLKKDVLATKQDIADLKLEMANYKSEIIRWMFIFWTTQLITMLGIIGFILKK